MKRFWKRANRGLVLAAVILAGLVIFIQIDQYQFKSSKPEIEQMTREYLEMEKNGADLMELEKFTLGSLKKAVFEGDTKNGSLMAGQVAGMMKEILPARKIFENMMEGYARCQR